jgi:hypothetical protein
MAGLMALPTELLIYICECSDLKTVQRLSTTSRRFRAIWLNNSSRISDSVLKPTLPAYDDAVALAKLEANPGGHSTPVDWLPILMRHIKRATTVVVDKRDDLQSSLIFLFPIMSQTQELDAYYVVCQVVLAYDHPQLRHALF